jgi:hypothetical protein
MTNHLIRLCALAVTAALLDHGASAAEPLVLAPGPAEPLPVLLHTHNLNMLTASAFDGITVGGPHLEKAVRQQRPAGLRFPGGTLANNYLWRTDSFSEPKNDLTEWAGQQIELFRKLGTKHDLPGYARVCVREGLEPIWVLNIYEETPESVVAMMRHLDELGLKVNRVEFGNEPYWDKRSVNNVRAYIDLCRPLAAALNALKKDRPGLRLGACFAPIHNPANYRDLWNAPLARETWFDAIVYHEYYGGQGFALEKGAPVPVAALLRPESLVREFCDEFAALLPQKPVWFTEWNLGSHAIKQWKNTGAELLFIAAVQCELVERRRQIELACFHQIYQESFGTFFYDKKAARIQTTASYELFRLIGAAFASGGSLHPVAFADDSVRGFVSGGENERRVFLLNRGAEAKTITLPADMGADRHLHLLPAAPELKLPLSRPLIKSSTVTGSEVVLPAHSIALIAGAEALAIATDAAANLFPPRPHLTLWYPPHAATQPAFDPHGDCAIDLKPMAGKDFAVITMDLVSLGLEKDGAYTLDFTAQGSAEAGLVVKLPDVAQTKDRYLPLKPTALPQRLDFAYDPAVNEGQLKLVIPKDTIAAGGKVTLGGFRLSKWERFGK